MTNFVRLARKLAGRQVASESPDAFAKNCRDQAQLDSLTFTQDLIAASYQSSDSDQRKLVRPLFIDIGANVGQGFSYFSSLYSPSLFDYICVEPNPHCQAPLRQCLDSRFAQKRRRAVKMPSSYTIVEAAITGGSSGEQLLFGLTEDSRGKMSDGASINPEHNSTFYTSDSGSAISVKTINASEFLQNHAADRPLTIVKIDIEGAEYDVLEELIRTNTHTLIDRFYIEWHTKYFAGQLKSEYLIREKQLKSLLGDLAREWY